jgi:hypothetical protein
MIYKRDCGPNGLRLWTDPTVRVFLGVLTLGALFVFWYEFEPILTFHPVNAVVVGSDVAKVRLTGRRSSHDEYQSEIFYRYEVAGTPYMGRKYSRIDLEASPSFALMRARAYGRGNTIRAWYNPLQPSEAVVSREPNVKVLGLMCLFLLTSWLGSSRRMLRADRPPPTPRSTPIE